MGRKKTSPVRLANQSSAAVDYLGGRIVQDPVALLAAEEGLLMHVDTVQESLAVSPDNNPRTERSSSRKKKKKRRRKSVRFVDQVEVIEPPEIQVWEDEKDSLQVIYTEYSETSAREHDNEYNAVFSLGEHLWHNAQPYDNDSPVCVIRTYAGAMVLLQRVGGFSDVHSIARAIEDGTIQLQLSQQGETEGKTGLQLSFWLTQQALQDVASPRRVPLNRRRGKRLRPLLNLEQALHSLLCLEHQRPPIRDSKITAKQVYALVDNVQLKAAPERKPMAPIKGLIPKLRPYQESAVQWMLDREKGGTLASNGAEWELAWVVLIEGEHSTTVVSLPEYTANQRQREKKSLFYSPFVGWLVASYEEARAVSLDSESGANVRGGILAESMGLGKTVEVLACILANPCCQDGGQQVGARRQLDFGSIHSAKLTHPVSPGCSSVTESEESVETELEGVLVEQNKTSVEPRVSRAAVPVTPDVGAVEQSSLEDRWMDMEDRFGACICGRSIEFGEPQVVVCESCSEPMHTKCAGLEEDPRRHGVSVVYRRTIKNDSMQCRVCDESQCPCCVAKRSNEVLGGTKNLIPSRATLIVTPPSILCQWEREIRKHTVAQLVSHQEAQNGLKVVVYPGIRELCKYGSVEKKRKRKVGASGLDERPTFELIHPRILADADIVLMTFDALMGDLGHSNANPFVANSAGSKAETTLRSRKRYRVVPSPLSSIRWWRVCLDEAQRIETPTAASARMALKLEAQHRWCVSGTPVGRGELEDLYGLLLFLRLAPFSDRQWFNKCFSLLYGNVDDRISHLLSKCFWRSTKASHEVRLQMGVPEQVEKKVMLRFSSVERHFYNRHLEATLAIVGDLTENKNGSKRSKTSQLDLLAANLHKLRAACCHPQVGSGGVGKTKKRKTAGQKGRESSSGSGILTMCQILDRLIDDAKLKCEEAQRLVLLHTNAMAALSRLMVEARQNGVIANDSDEALLARSCRLYQESLRITEENAKPCAVHGEAILSGCSGFRSSRKVIRYGKALLDWQLVNNEASHPKNNERCLRPVWSRLDFEGPSRRIIEIRARRILELPEELIAGLPEDHSWRLLHPKDCALQVSNAAVGGEFVDAVSFSLPNPKNDPEAMRWFVESGFRTHKSKSWRLVVKTYHGDEIEKGASNSLYVGLEVELCEASISNDQLQRLHALHNASESFSAFLSLKPRPETAPAVSSRTDIKRQLADMQKESRRIEQLYMECARYLHQECQRRLGESSRARKHCEDELVKMGRRVRSGHNVLRDCWDDGWWDDLISIYSLHGSHTEHQSLINRLQEELDSFLGGAFDRSAYGAGALAFHDLNGLRIRLSLSVQDLRKKIPGASHASCMQAVRDLSPYPTDREIFENGHCRKCKADWNQTGPVCGHCKIGERLDDLVPDRLLLCMLQWLYSWTRGTRGSGKANTAKSAAQIEERASKFFETLEAARKEKSNAESAWRVHLDLLNDIDELNQCKRSMRLLHEGEVLSDFTEEELNAVVVPVDVVSRFHDHNAKQAMALANLRRSKDTLRYLKNQSTTRQSERENCILCLSELDGDRGVLACGHSFHIPCLKRLVAKASNHQMVSCPLRCFVRTKKDEILTASDKRKDDGSQSTRHVKGSWSTKVTRLVADILDVSGLGEKSIVFSMWEDMLDVMEEALFMNGAQYVRATSLAHIGKSIRQFRSSDCSVLLLNVKNGAEGLTILEATHVFMVEPLLNCGMDSQAISRIHRIGQTNKTYVHRYIMDNTVEVKIDKLRMEHLEDEVEDASHEARKHMIKAGGIDGGFSSEKELLDVLRIE